VRNPVLLVDADEALSTALMLALRSAGMEVVALGTGDAALARLQTESFGLVVLDPLLPDHDGLEICRRARALDDVPIIITSALSSTQDIVEGLEAGADDYLTKPFEPLELVARAKAIRRRLGPSTSDLRQVADLEIDLPGFEVRKAGRTLHLSATEFRVLVELSTHRGQVLSRQQLMERVWRYDYLGDSRVVDMAVKRLRHKIEDDPSDPRVVVTVRGVGYRMPRA
jgi:two-component system response regulator MtrA